jgi:uncharacterized OB-fold protein
LQEERILGRACPRCEKVYVPARATCPTCCVGTGEDIEVLHTGVVTTFCVVNIPFEGQLIDPPYACAHVVLDGADVQIFHLVSGCDVDEVRMGMRVRAVWAPEGRRPFSLESIRHFAPTGEPDAPFESYREYL